MAARGAVGVALAVIALAWLTYELGSRGHIWEQPTSHSENGVTFQFQGATYAVDRFGAIRDSEGRIVPEASSNVGLQLAAATADAGTLNVGVPIRPATLQPYEETTTNQGQINPPDGAAPKNGGVIYGISAWHIVSEVGLMWWGRALFLWGAYSIGRNVGRQTKGAAPYFSTVGAAIVLAFVIWAGYGTHTEDDDPIFGGGTTVQDFVPTGADRNQYGVEAFLTLVAPALLGVRHGQRSLGQPGTVPKEESVG